MLNPNQHCQCSGPGHCPRHQINKDQRHWEYCSGNSNAPDCGLRWWVAWEHGNLGATAPESPIMDPQWPCKPVKIPTTPKPTAPTDKCYVGTAIKRILRDEYKISTTENCKCNRKAREIDRWTCEECRGRLEEIVEMLMDGAAERWWIRPLAKVAKRPMQDNARDLALRAIIDEEHRLEKVSDQKKRTSETSGHAGSPRPTEN